MIRLVVLPDAPRAHARRLVADLSGQAEVLVADDADAARGFLATADAAYGTLTPSLLAAAPRLRWLQAPQAGPPPEFYFAELVAHPVVVTNLRDTYTDHVATHAVALLLALARNLHTYARARSWAPLDDVLHLQRATVLIVGLGAVGREIARQLGPFDCTIIATDARLSESPAGVAELHPAEALDAVLPRADVVVLTVPHTPATDRLITATRLARFKPGAMLVNVGRGALVDLDDLAAALRAGQLRGAAIDVVPHEPLPADHPLWTVPQALITPHVAGVGPETDERRYAVVRDNAERFAAGRPVRNVVDKVDRF